MVGDIAKGIVASGSTSPHPRAPARPATAIVSWLCQHPGLGGCPPTTASRRALISTRPPSLTVVTSRGAHTVKTRASEPRMSFAKPGTKPPKPVPIRGRGAARRKPSKEDEVSERERRYLEELGAIFKKKR